MKILHICLTSHYTEGMTYQDNLLPLYNYRDGHQVTIISNCSKYDKGKLVETPEEDTILNSGIRLIRKKYVQIFGKKISDKIIRIKGLYELIDNIKPDVILFHGVSGWEVLTVTRYKKNNPKTKLYFDCHADFNNSAKNWLSRNILHRSFYRIIFNKARPVADKIFYLSFECSLFLKELYRINDSEMEFFPLGGEVVEANIKNDYSKEIRSRHNFKSDDILLMHSGKLDQGKRTELIILALKKNPDPRLKLLIAGSMPNETKDILRSLIEQDERITYLGWLDDKALKKHLSAADIYIQPGTQSATLQTAICCGTAVAIYPHPSHKPYLNGNGYWIRDQSDIEKLLQEITTPQNQLTSMKTASYAIAHNLLDYKIIASRLYH